MTYNGSGTFNRPWTWAGDAAAGTKILASRHDTHDAELAAGLSNAICRDGQSSITADIPWNGHKITGLAPGVAPTDAVNLAQLGTVRSFSTGIVISGADANGLVSFTSGTGYTGLSFTNSDTAWISRKAGEPANYPNRLALNDKADATGKDVFFIADDGRVTLAGGHDLSVNAFYSGSEWKVGDAGWGFIQSHQKATGTFTMFGSGATSTAAGAAMPLALMFQCTKEGNFSAAGSVTATAGHFVGAPTVAVLASSAAGTVYLRPNGMSSTTGQTTIDSAGLITVNGGIGATGTIGGTNIVSGSGIVASNASTLYFRPNGAGSAAGHAVLAADGNFSVSTHMTVGGNTISNGYKGKAGLGGVYGGSYFNFNWTGALAGWVDTTNLGNVTFSSDYRTKKDVEDLPSTWEQVRALRPIRYTQAEFQPPMSDETKAALLKQAVEEYAIANNIDPSEVSEKDLPAKPAPAPLFQADDIERWGFIAHELQETLVPSAATGVKDGEDLVQSPNPWTVIAALTKVVQELMDRIETLEAAAR